MGQVVGERGGVKEVGGVERGLRGEGVGFKGSVGELSNKTSARLPYSKLGCPNFSSLCIGIFPAGSLLRPQSQVAS